MDQTEKIVNSNKFLITKTEPLLPVGASILFCCQHDVYFLKYIANYQNSAALLQLHHSVMGQVDLDRANVGGLWLTTLLVFSHDLERSYFGGVTHLWVSEKNSQQSWIFNIVSESTERGLACANRNFKVKFPPVPPLKCKCRCP